MVSDFGRGARSRQRSRTESQVGPSFPIKLLFGDIDIVSVSCRYLDPSKITRLLLVEPNPGMHAGLRKNALAAGFKEGQFEIVACGAEEKAKVEQLTGLGNESVDSVVSLLALCGIPESR